MTKIGIEWVTQVTEHHRVVLDEKDVPEWVLAVLATAESGRVQGEYFPDDETEWGELVDREGADTERHSEVEERYVSCVQVEPPSPDEVGYHSHVAMAAAEYGVSSQAGLASYTGRGTLIVAPGDGDREHLVAVDPGRDDGPAIIASVKRITLGDEDGLGYIERGRDDG
jgi:hypothetical protein